MINAGQTFGAIARDALKQLSANIERLRNAPTAEAIHHARVAVRRLRTVLATFRATVGQARTGDPRTAALDAELKRLADALGPARDFDVFLAGAYDRAMIAGENDLTGLAQRLLAARGAAYETAGAVARARWTRRLLTNVAEWVERAEAAVGAGPARAWAGASLDAAREGLGKRRALIARDRRHRLRIRAKRLRYLADALTPVFADHPRRRRRFMAALTDMIDRLGDLNDLAVAETLCAEFDAPGLMVAAELAREARLIAAAGRAFKTLKNARPFWPSTR